MRFLQKISVTTFLKTSHDTLYLGLGSCDHFKRIHDSILKITRFSPILLKIIMPENKNHNDRKVPELALFFILLMKHNF